MLFVLEQFNKQKGTVDFLVSYKFLKKMHYFDPVYNTGA